jgi:hypothetical protein
MNNELGPDERVLVRSRCAHLALVVVTKEVVPSAVR